MQHPHFSTINQPGLLLLFSRRDVQNSENEKVFSAWKLLKLTGEVSFGSERTVQDRKFHFLLNSFFSGKYPNLTTYSLFEGGYLCNVISSKSEKLLKLITHAEPDLNQMMLK